MLKKTFIFIIDVENICETFFRVIEQILFTNIGNIIDIFMTLFDSLMLLCWIKLLFYLTPNIRTIDRFHASQSFNILYGQLPITF